MFLLAVGFGTIGTFGTFGRADLALTVCIVVGGWDLGRLGRLGHSGRLTLPLRCVVLV